MATLTIVTGASAGLGRALLRAAPAGHRVDVSRSGPPPEADEHLTADLADPASWAVVGAAFERFATRTDLERIVLIHNAGTLEPIGFAGEVDADAYTANVLLNSAAPQVLGHRFLAAVQELDLRRELVQLSSGAARTAYPGWSSDGAAKAAVDQWVRSVGEEQQRRGGVRVLSIAPGVVATGMQELIRTTDERDLPNVARFHELHDQGQLEDPDDVAARLWRLLDEDDDASGSVLDLRRR
jgi:benzil reductase ((S)-benzoin forming)